MTERDRLFLSHILGAIADIEAFTAEGRALFMSDRKTQSAVLREFEIVGEALKNLSQELIATQPSVPWRQIAGTRDRLIHAYSASISMPCGPWSSKTCLRCAIPLPECSTQAEADIGRRCVACLFLLEPAPAQSLVPVLLHPPSVYSARVAPASLESTRAIV
jgi:uncharacterized protein with HEPN domain